MNKTAILTALLALNAATRQGAAVNPDLLTPWVEKWAGPLKDKAQALRDGATWAEVGALLEQAVQAAQELRPVLAGTARAQIVLVVVQTLVREFAPPSAVWLGMLLQSEFAQQLVEMAFKRLFPGG